MTDRRPYECEAVLQYFDTQTGNEPPAEIDAGALRHIEACPDCSAELDRRAALRLRVKQAVQATAAAGADIESRIRSSLRREQEEEPFRQPWNRALLRVAAMIAVCFGVWVLYEVGRVRLVTASQDLYIQALQSRVGNIFGAGLGDHLHCARFRQFPAQAPAYEELLHEMGPELSALAPLVKARIPEEFEIVMAHRCAYQGRRFIHLVLRTESKLASLVITEKREGEVLPPGPANGLRLAAVRGYQIASMESSRHWIYFISDLDRERNRTLLADLGPEVRQFLESLEG